ncbi:hypothetical protein T439DRAFT_205579 [Meredithblackwellia eburnea MCA 4105]
MPRSAPFSPHPNRETYKDLLIFEERLKQNAERLQKQRRKYEAFLFSLVLIILYLAYSVFVIPSIYSLVHYGNVTMFLVSLVTLVLFFATGMYNEKITYAYKFVPQANRALRPFNIYLNTRTRTRFPFLAPLFRLPIFSSAPAPASPPAYSHSPPSSAPLSRRTSASSTHSAGSARSIRAGRSPPPSELHVFPSSSRPPSPPTTSSNYNDPVTRATPSPSPPPPATRGVPLAPIPPATNPRGELIFSSRVSAQFREGYERYRGEWERRRYDGNSANKHSKWKVLGWIRGVSAGSGSGSDKEKERETSVDTSETGGPWQKQRGRSMSATGKVASRQSSPRRTHRNSIPSSSRTPSASPPNSRPSSPDGGARTESFAATLTTTEEDPDGAS